MLKIFKKKESRFDEEIDRLWTELEYLHPETEDYELIQERLAKLYEMKIKEKEETISKGAVIKEIAHFILKAAEITAPLIATAAFLMKILGFETTGTVTSMAGKAIAKSALRI